MATSSQILANNMAQGGGVQAQLAMGRDQIALAQMQAQRNMEAQRLAQAMQLAQMDQEMQRAQMDQQGQQFMAGQDFDRQRMAEDQRRFGMTFGLDEQQAGREQALFDFEQQQRENEQMGKAAGFGAFGSMGEAEGRIAQFARSPFMTALQQWAGDDPQKQSIAMGLADEQLGRELDFERASGSGSAPAAIQVGDKVNELYQKAAQAYADDDQELGQYYENQMNIYRQSQKMDEKGFNVGVGPGAGGAQEGFLDFAGKKKASEAEGTKRGGWMVEMEKARPIDEFALKQLTDTNDLVQQDIDKALSLVKDMNAAGRFSLQSLPLSEQQTFKNLLSTISNNVAFDKLSEMRKASKTGGAVGQLSDDERKALGELMGSLDSSNETEDLVRVLGRLAEWKDQAVQNQISLYDQTYGGRFGNFSYTPMRDQGAAGADDPYAEFRP